jgi:hypothetical protein
MAGTNGAGAIAPARMRFTAVPSFQMIELEVLNPEYDPNFPDRPETVVRTFKAYVKGDRCPVWVEIEAQSAWEDWRQASYSGIGEDGSPTYEYNYRAERVLRRDLLRAVIEGLDQQEADVLGADGGPWDLILEKLGWYQRDIATESEDAENPEATAVLPNQSATKK